MEIIYFYVQIFEHFYIIQGGPKVGIQYIVYSVFFKD